MTDTGVKNHIRGGTRVLEGVAKVAADQRKLRFFNPDSPSLEKVSMLRTQAQASLGFHAVRYKHMNLSSNLFVLSASNLEQFAVC